MFYYYYFLLSWLKWDYIGLKNRKKSRRTDKMNRLFGKKSKEPDHTLDDASRNVDERVKTVDQRIAKYDVELGKLKCLIQKTSGPTQQRYKQRAAQIIQQKRTCERQQDTMMAQQFNMDQLKFAVDTVKDSQAQVKAMATAKKTIKKDLKKFNLDKIEDLHDDIADLYYDTLEVQEILGRSYEVPEEIDNDEIVAELEALYGIGEGEVTGGNYLDEKPVEAAPLPDLSSIQFPSSATGSKVSEVEAVHELVPDTQAKV